MISEIQHQWMNRHILNDSAGNSHVDNYLKIEARNQSVCPICNKIFADLVSVNYHISHDHIPGEMEDHEKEINRFFNPLESLRELEVMQRVKNPPIVGYGKFFGDIITSSHNQNVMLNIFGKQGSGKSNAAISIAQNVAEYVAWKMGGKDDGKGGKFSSDPETYFNMNNVAIMKIESILPVLRKIDEMRFAIIILDDIGGEWNARDSQKKQNKEINKVVQTFRDANIMMICTTVSDFLLDKVGRRLAHFQIEMMQSLHAFGLAIGKLKIVKEVYQTGDMYFVFPVYKGVQYTRIAFERMRKDLADKYEARRIDIRRKYTKGSLDTIEGGGKGEVSNRPEPKWKAIVPEVNRIMIENPGISIRAIAKATGAHPETVKKAVNCINGVG